MPRAIWTGSVSFGLVTIPVSLHAAEKPDDMSFSLLDRGDLSPIGYKTVNKSTGQEISRSDTVRGYELKSGKYIVLEDADFRRANVKATQTVEILAFVDGPQIPIAYYDKPYYLAPGKRGERAYALLRETLRRSGKVGIAKLVVRTRQYLAALVPMGPVLVVELLRFSHELRDPTELDLPGEKLTELHLSDKEIAMAERLVEEMSERFEPEKYKDDYRQDLLALIERKAKEGAKTIREPPSPPPEEEDAPEVVDLMDLLKRSVARSAPDGEERRRTKAARPSRTRKKSGRS